MTEDNASGQRTFDLQATDRIATGRGIIISATSVRWSGGECPFEDIVALELLCDTNEDLEATCSIIRTNESRLTIKLTGKPRGEPAIYRNFLRSFVEELGPAHRARIVFRPVHRRPAALVWGALLAAGVGLFGWGIITNQIAAAPENQYVIPFTGLMIPLFALAFWKSRHRIEPKPVDPDKLVVVYAGSRDSSILEICRQVNGSVRHQPILSGPVCPCSRNEN
jgi:hypothetical protein